MLDSLLDQGIPSSEYEIIVVDDGSSEKPIVVKDYVTRYPQIKYHRINHQGLSPARNYGLSVSAGKWIYFCDSDDFLQPKVLGTIIDKAEERQLEIIHAGNVRISEHSPIPNPKRNFDSVSETQTGYEFLGNPPTSYSWGIWAYLFRTSVIKDLLFEDLMYIEDGLFMLKLLPEIHRIAHIDVTLYYYVQRNSSILHFTKKKNGQDYLSAWSIYHERLSAMIEDPSTPEQTAKSLSYKREIASYKLISEAFLYCPVRDTIKTISLLSDRNCYPLKVAGSGRFGRLCKLINHRSLWIFLCRIFHILPLWVRERI